MIFYSNLPKTEQKNKVKFVKGQFSKKSGTNLQIGAWFYFGKL